MKWAIKVTGYRQRNYNSSAHTVDGIHRTTQLFSYTKESEELALNSLPHALEN